MAGLLNTPPPAMEEVFPGQKPLATVGQPASTGFPTALNMHDAPDQLSTQLADKKDYSQDPKSQWEQNFEKQNKMTLAGKGVYDQDLINVYMRDKYGIGTTDAPWEDEYLNRTGISRDDVTNIVEQTAQGRDMLQGKMDSMGQGDMQKGGPGDPGFAEFTGNALSGDFKGFGQMDFSGQPLGQMVGKFAKGGVQKFLTNAGMNTGAAGALINGISTAVSTQDVGAVLKQGKKDATKATVKFISDFAKDKLGTTIPIAGLIGGVANIASDVSKGMDFGDALGDALSNMGLSVGAALFGSILGPVGTFLVPAIVSMLVGDNLVSEGIIGDAFDSRRHESFRDLYEDDDSISDTDMSALNYMAKNMEETGSYKDSGYYLGKHYDRIKSGQTAQTPGINDARRYDTYGQGRTGGNTSTARSDTSATRDSWSGNI